MTQSLENLFVASDVITDVSDYVIRSNINIFTFWFQESCLFHFSRCSVDPFRNKVMLSEYLL